MATERAIDETWLQQLFQIGFDVNPIRDTSTGFKVVDTVKSYSVTFASDCDRLICPYYKSDKAFVFSVSREEKKKITEKPGAK